MKQTNRGYKYFKNIMNYSQHLTQIYHKINIIHLYDSFIHHGFLITLQNYFGKQF